MIGEWAATPGCRACSILLGWVRHWEDLELKVAVELQLAQGHAAMEADLVCPTCFARYSPAGVLAERSFQDPDHAAAAERHQRYRKRIGEARQTRHRGPSHA